MFPDRYHVESIDSVRQVRHALAYVLNNWRKHRQDRGRAWIDPLPVATPQTWLVAEGWKRAGPISVHHVPGA